MSRVHQHFNTPLLGFCSVLQVGSPLVMQLYDLNKTIDSCKMNILNRNHGFNHLKKEFTQLTKSKY